MSNKQHGFTLIELMVVVAIVGILMVIGLPSYRTHVAKVNRSAAQQLILSAATKEQQYFLDARAFTTAPDATGLSLAAPAEQGWTCSSTQCTNANYTVAISKTDSPPSFTVTATATAGGTNAGEVLTMDNKGAKTPPALWK